MGADRSELCQLFNESYVFYSQRRQFAAFTVAELYYAFALWPQSQLQSIYLHCPADWIFSHIFTLETRRSVREFQRGQEEGRGVAFGFCVILNAKATLTISGNELCRRTQCSTDPSPSHYPSPTPASFSRATHR